MYQATDRREEAVVLCHCPIEILNGHLNFCAIGCLIGFLYHASVNLLLFGPPAINDPVRLLLEKREMG